MDELNRIIMDEIGLDVDNTYIIDQDYGDIVTFNGRYMRYFSPEIEVNINEIDRKTNIILDSTNVRTVTILFAYYLDKLYNLEGRYFKRFFPVVDKDGYGRVEVVTETEEVISSDNFFNENLRFIDLIIKLSGNGIDLHKYDIK